MKAEAGGLGWWRKYRDWVNWAKIGYLIFSIVLLVAVGRYLSQRDRGKEWELSEESFPKVLAGYSLQGASSPAYDETCFDGTNPRKYLVAWYGTRRQIRAVILEYRDKDGAREGLNACAETTAKKLSRNLGKEVELTREGGEKSMGFWQEVVAYPFGGEEAILYSVVAINEQVVWIAIDGEENVGAKHEQIAKEMVEALDRERKSE